MGVVNALLDEGSLITDGAGATSRGRAHPAEHARMLHDDRRTGDYLKAIKLAVRPGDVVLEVGTGSGVLAVAAARAGARHVYAIEASDIADVAQRVFEINGVADRITLLRGWSRHIELPEPADVLISEAELRQRSVPPGSRQRWQSLYDMDFEPLIDAATGQLSQHAVEVEAAAGWHQVGAAVDLAHLELSRFATTGVEAAAHLVATEPFNAVAMTFRAGLCGPVTHVFDPWRWPMSSWPTSVWILPRPTRNPYLRVTYRRRVPGFLDGLEVRDIGLADLPHSG